MSSTQDFNPITVDYAIEQCTDLAKLRELARLYRRVMISEHQQTGHVLNAADCASCQEAIDECDSSYACADFRRRQHDYENALRADVILRIEDPWAGAPLAAEAVTAR